MKNDSVHSMAAYLSATTSFSSGRLLPSFISFVGFRVDFFFTRLFTSLFIILSLYVCSRTDSLYETEEDNHFCAAFNLQSWISLSARPWLKDEQSVNCSQTSTFYSQIETAHKWSGWICSTYLFCLRFEDSWRMERLDKFLQIIVGYENWITENMRGGLWFVFLQHFLKDGIYIGWAKNWR